MLVKHLIRELQKVNPDAPVMTEGCDCYGDTFALEVDSDGMVLIQRSDGMSVGRSEQPKYDNLSDTQKPLASTQDIV